MSANQLALDNQNKRQLSQFFCDLHSVFNFPYGEHRVKWFISFGALLYFIRDKNLGIPFQQDYDISIIGRIDTHMFRKHLIQSGFEIISEFANDVTNEPFQIVAKHRFGQIIDVYFWVDSCGYLWHTYRQGEGYKFKGTPKYAFEGEIVKYKWNENSIELNFPAKYGTLLDLWYPGWYIPDVQFGQSSAEAIRETASCANLSEVLHGT